MMFYAMGIKYFLIIKYKLNNGSGINQYSLTNEGKYFITWHR